MILAHSLLRTFPEVDTENIGITGISWGGIITNVVTGLDKRFKFSIPVYGCGFLYETPLYKKLLNKLTQEGRYFYLKNWEPSLYIPLQNLPTLFVNGTNDKHFFSLHLLICFHHSLIFSLLEFLKLGYFFLKTAISLFKTFSTSPTTA